MKDILIVDDDELCTRLFEHICRKLGCSFISVNSGTAALELLYKETFKIVLTDVKLPGAEGPQILEKVKASSPETDVIIVTGYGSIEQAVECMRLGACDYITKPCHPEKLEMTIRRLFERQSLIAETRYLRSRLDHEYRFESVIGKSTGMLRVLELAAIAAESDSTVLITGESGTGKELVANCIHQNSVRKRKPFIKVNCPAIPDGLIETELFGHERGAFTSAVRKRIGKFEEARGGTIFLDEIAELPLHTQTKLLQVLQDNSIERVGSNARVNVDVRVIAATNNDLSSSMETNDFRKDLYWRLNVLHIDIPPLRERREDIPPVIEYYLRKRTKSTDSHKASISPDALKALLDYDWPGNVREIMNALEQAWLLSRGAMIQVEHLPAAIRKNAGRNNDEHGSGCSLEAAVRNELQRVLAKHNWNRTRAAKELGIDRTSLIRKIKKYGIAHVQAPSSN